MPMPKKKFNRLEANEIVAFLYNSNFEAGIKSDKAMPDYVRISQAKAEIKALDAAPHDAPGTPAALRLWLDTYLTDKAQKRVMSAMRQRKSAEKSKQKQAAEQPILIQVNKAASHAFDELAGYAGLTKKEYLSQLGPWLLESFRKDQTKPQKELKPFKRVLDPACGSRMMWFDKENPEALFGDRRDEQHTLSDGRSLHIKPDLQMDFTKLPFPDESFNLVAFDPPHLTHAGKKSWLRAKYGVLGDGWKEELKKGFAECFRVLASDGVLVFKWSQENIRLQDVLALTPVKPLFGHPTGRSGATHWCVFIKPASI